MDFPNMLPSGGKATTGDVNATASLARPEDNTSSASTNTKGSWVECFASTPFPALGIDVSIAATLNGNSDRLVDIGIGAASSELVIIGDLPAPNIADRCMYHAFFPLMIPEGSRLSHRSAATVASQGTLVGMTLVAGGFIGQHASAQVCTTLGAVAADSGGTGIDPGGTAGTKGSWVQVPASTVTDKPFRWLGIGLGNQANAARASGSFLMDVAIGAAGSEQIILENLHINSQTNGEMLPWFIGPFPVYIPEGSQLSARASSSLIDATDRLFDVIFYGLS